jgi:fluoride exporter
MMVVRSPDTGWPIWALVACTALGGSVGAALRATALNAASSTTDPAVVFALNLVGSIAVGAALGWGLRIDRPLWALLAPGFGGGLTTFSTVTVEVAIRLRDGQPVGALLLVVVMVGPTLAGAGLGWRLGLARRVALR